MPAFVDENGFVHLYFKENVFLVDSKMRGLLAKEER